MKRTLVWCFTLLGPACFAVEGCAPVTSTTGTGCTVSITVTPTTATLDHSVAGNSQTYVSNVTAPPGCPLPPLVAPMWKVSDTVDASISLERVATCNAAALNPITVSAGAVYPNATLICK